MNTFRKITAPMEKDASCRMDMAVLIAFPIVFLIFNIAYWTAFYT